MLLVGTRPIVSPDRSSPRVIVKGRIGVSWRNDSAKRMNLACLLCMHLRDLLLHSLLWVLCSFVCLCWIARSNYEAPERRSKGGATERGSKGGVPERGTKGGAPELGSKSAAPERRSKGGAPKRGSKGGAPERRSKGGAPEHGLSNF
jgi:hypothetical protein